jgi:ActR/RegA family two-component response regulator
MNQGRLLIADNSRTYANSLGNFLKSHEYVITIATTPETALEEITKGAIDLAILDLRLRDDSEGDRSGLDVAKNSDPSVPKIIVSDYGSLLQAREALGQDLEGVSPAVRWVKKAEGYSVVLEAVQQAFKLPRFRATTERLSGHIRYNYEDTREQSQKYFWSSLVVAIAGIGIIFYGIVQVLAGWITPGVAYAVAGILVEVVSVLLHVRSDGANKRVDKYHVELLATYRFENLLAAIDQLSSSDEREGLKVEVIRAATNSWLIFNEQGTHENSGERKKK